MHTSIVLLHQFLIKRIVLLILLMSHDQLQSTPLNSIRQVYYRKSKYSEYLRTIRISIAILLHVVQSGWWRDKAYGRG